MSNSSRRRPVWLPVLVYLVLMPTMLWLGFWQLDKSERQQQRRSEFANADSAPLRAGGVSDPAAQRFRRVRARGHYDSDRQLLIDNIVRDGRNGFYVIAPLVRDDGTTLLVNRGWIPQSPTREPLVPIDVKESPRTVEGRVGSLPSGGIRLGPVAEAGEGWPRVLQFPTLEDAAQVLDRPLLGWVLLADDPDDGSDGFVRDWRPGGLPPERHLGYAVQWFAMAFALTVIAGIMLVRARRGKDRS